MRVKDKYISPFTEFGFKKLFGTEMNKDILIDFSNELLKKYQGKIEEKKEIYRTMLAKSLEINFIATQLSKTEIEQLKS